MKVDCGHSFWKKLVEWFPGIFRCKTKKVSWEHLIGAGLFLGLYNWRDNGITNDAPRDMFKLISKFADAGGNLMQFQLMYEEGAVFEQSKGLTLDSSKINYSLKIRDECALNGVGVVFVLFDHCSLKKAARWAINPMNRVNGGPFTNAFDVYYHFDGVKAYVTEIVNKLNGDNVAWEIINEGESSNFAGQVRDHLVSLGVTRITTSGSNPGGLWRYSEHNKTSPSDVKSNQLPNTDGKTWVTADIRPICNAIRATMNGGLVFDGPTDAIHSWAEFLANIKG